MPKYNYKFYIALVLALILALVKPAAITTIVLFIVALIGYFIKETKLKDSIEDVHLDLKEEKALADDRADDAFLKLHHLINSMPSPLIYINQKGDFEVSNIYFDQMIQIDAKHVYDVAIDSPLRQIMLDAFLNEKQFIKEFSYRDIDFQVHSIPIMKDNRYNGCLLVFQDVTRITEGEKMQKRFIADASHELRTPISSIIGMSEILNQETFDDENTRKEFLEQIDVEAKRLDHIVKDLLLQSRLKENQVYLEKNIFNLRSFFEGLIYEKRRELHKNNIEVVLTCPSDITVFADQFRLGQVFLNLFNNSINYTKNGRINIDCDCWQDECKIVFKDNGKGIPKEILPHIFDRFFRGETDRSREFGGSGLGLAISKSIVEAHDGSIEVESEAGKGTSFIIKLTQN